MAGAFPSWVPVHVRHYLVHTECGQSIRALAREAGCHASTVLRQVRRNETRRDDPLVDMAFTRLAAAARTLPNSSREDFQDMKMDKRIQKQACPDEDRVNAEARRILRDEYGVEHTTVQVEPPGYGEQKTDIAEADW